MRWTVSTYARIIEQRCAKVSERRNDQLSSVLVGGIDVKTRRTEDRADQKGCQFICFDIGK